MKITTENGMLVARNEGGAFLAAVPAPTSKRDLRAAQRDVEELAKGAGSGAYGRQQATTGHLQTH